MRNEAISLPDGFVLEPVPFDALEGWQADAHGQALEAFRRSCTGLPEDWRDTCEAAHAVTASGDEEARRFFEARFRPFSIVPPSGEKLAGLFTGYYEPLLNGSRRQGGVYQTPLLRRPADLEARPWPVRAAIEAAIAADAPEIRDLAFVWVDDPVAAFFLHIQGSGRVRLDDGTVIRVAFDGKNGRPYTAIGRVLVERGELDPAAVSMQSIRNWLAVHPGEAAQVMAENEAYVFFRPEAIRAGDPGPRGAAGVSLTPGRSLAIDRTVFSMGVPFWLESRTPVSGGSSPWRRLMVAQDTGSAIQGVLRGDIFFGFGAEAAFYAGAMQAPGRLAVLLPVNDSNPPG